MPKQDSKDELLLRGYTSFMIHWRDRGILCMEKILQNKLNRNMKSKVKDKNA